MNDMQFLTEIGKILEKDNRFSTEAYAFVGRAVSHTVQSLERGGFASRHITGRELVNGLLALADREYGPLAYEVLKGWGIDSDKAVGQIVFNMIEHKLLSKNDEDKMEDFDLGLDLEKALSQADGPEAAPVQHREDMIIE
jgi:uncharacterized repeat protein (TIGR04138 family)